VLAPVGRSVSRFAATPSSRRARSSGRARRRCARTCRSRATPAAARPRGPNRWPAVGLRATRGPNRWPAVGLRATRAPDRWGPAIREGRGAPERAGPAVAEGRTLPRTPRARGRGGSEPTPNAEGPRSRRVGAHPERRGPAV